MQTILVTGGAGYIGSQTVIDLINNRFKVIVFDNLSKGHAEVLPSQASFIKGDLNNLEDIESVFTSEKIDGIIHFAGSIEVAESQTNPEKYYYNNTVTTLNLLSVANKHGVKNLVFSSTAAVYGIPETVPIVESNLTNPINTYGYSKLIVENILKDYNRAYNLNSICLRYFNACGADIKARTGEMHEPETHLIPIILQVALGKRESITLYGQDYNTPDGTCVRDYIHTMDLASAHVLAIKKLIQTDTSICEAINLGTNKGFSNLEILNTVEKVTKKKINYKIGDRRPGDPDKLVADNTKAKQILGWEPKYSDLETIISTAWQWAQKSHN